MKIREIFEYEVNTSDLNDVFTVSDYIDCTDDMSCPFWDGHIHAENFTKRELEVLDNN